VQEDEPSKTAEYLQQFLHRFRIGEPPMVIPKARTGVRPVLPVVGGPLHTASADAAAAGAVTAAAGPGGNGQLGKEHVGSEEEAMQH
jgi:hypothetical protein